MLAKHVFYQLNYTPLVLLGKQLYPYVTLAIGEFSCVRSNVLLRLQLLCGRR